MTFDNKRVDFYTQGQYWIVKNDRIKIQGLYMPTHATSGLSVLKEIAFGGPFIQNNKLIIGATSAFFNGQAILPTSVPPSDFNQAGITARLDTVGETMQKGREGKAMHVIHLTFPEGVIVQINRWTEPTEGNYINVKLTFPGGRVIDGACGNFNGNPEDDSRASIRSRLGTTGVAQADLLFSGVKMEITQGNRPDINDCAPGLLSEAHEECKESEHKFIPSMACLIDVCFGGKGFAHQG